MSLPSVDSACLTFTTRWGVVTRSSYMAKGRGQASLDWAGRVEQGRAENNLAAERQYIATAQISE